MPVVTVAHRPDLSVERAVEIFSSHFASKYRVYKTRRPLLHFVVQKSDWTAVGVRLRQGDNVTRFGFGAFLPSFFLSFLLIGIVTYFILYFASWRHIEREVESFILNEPEFKDA